MPAAPADPALADLVAETEGAEPVADTGTETIETPEPTAAEGEWAPDQAGEPIEAEPESTEDGPPRPDGR